MRYKNSVMLSYKSCDCYLYFGRLCYFTIKFREEVSPRREGLLPYKRLIGMCRWMGSHFHNWTDYRGVEISVELLEWGGTFWDFLG